MRLLLIAAALLLGACPREADQRTIVDVCSSVGQQCSMGGGKLGVCMMAADGAFACESQH